MKIDIRDGISETLALELVLDVVRRGRVSQVPITFIICTILSIIMAVYIILNFEEVTWVIVYGIYQILSVGMIVFLLICLL